MSSFEIIDMEKNENLGGIVPMVRTHALHA